MDPEEEYELARQAQLGSHEALSRLVSLVRVPLFALAYAELRHYEDAQDAVASALVRICRHIHDLQEPQRVRTWMNRIVRNEARRLLQSRKPEVSMHGEEEAADLLPSALRLDIDHALERLPKDHARAIALFYLAGQPVGEIARRLGRPEGTIKFWLHQGRQQLAQQMEAYAPMTAQNERWTASIVSTEIDADLLSRMTNALSAAGWDTVKSIHDFEEAGRLEPSDAGDDARELHAPSLLKDSRCIILDEWIGGRSAFELIPLLNAAAERKRTAIFLLAGSRSDYCAPSDITVRAAYAAGVDMLLTKPFSLAEFERFVRHLRTALA